MDSDSDFEEGNFDTDEEADFHRILRGIRNDDPDIYMLEVSGYDDFVQNLTNEEWHEIGLEIFNNSHLVAVTFCDGALNDEKMSYLFRGLISSSSIQQLELYKNDLSASVRTVVPFLQHANNLQHLDLDDSNIQSEGFNILCRALRDSPIEELQCNGCSIESIEIDLDHFPRHLKALYLSRNSINTDGCREITKLLQGGDSTLTHLNLNCNKIDDKGVAILVDVLRNNTSLKCLRLELNSGILSQGRVMLLKLVNDISSISATLQSNHTLTILSYSGLDETDAGQEIQRHIILATEINAVNSGNPVAAAREKVIQTQLHSVRRGELVELLGVTRSLYSEISPLYLPEVLSLVGHTLGKGELYVALKSSIAGVISTVDMKRCITEEMAYHVAQLEKLRAKLAAIERKEGEVWGNGNKLRSNKRLRVV